MIIVRSPLRISLGGGGTDLPSFYGKNGTIFCSAAIDKYVYVAVSKPFENRIFVRYSKQENSLAIDDIEHPIVRESLKLIYPNVRSIEIASFADIPSGTGLGSSGSFTTALTKALNLYVHKSTNAADIAKMSTYLEADVLGEPVGVQDQYIAAFGGITEFNVNKEGQVSARPLHISSETLTLLEANLSLYYTGKSRSASSILQDQDLRSKSSEKQIRAELEEIFQIGLLTRDALEAGDLIQFGKLLHEHWNLKRRRSFGITSEHIDFLYGKGLKSGAVGGKLVGAGGGGFLLFYSEDGRKLRESMVSEGLQEVRFRFDFEGTKAIFS